MDKALRKAIEKSSVTAIARACGITTQAVSQWDRVPPSRVLIVSRLTGIPPHRLRPDIMPAPEAA